MPNIRRISRLRNKGKTMIGNNPCYYPLSMMKQVSDSRELSGKKMCYYYAPRIKYFNPIRLDGIHRSAKLQIIGWIEKGRIYLPKDD